jgi:hypothetical protein
MELSPVWPHDAGLIVLAKAGAVGLSALGNCRHPGNKSALDCGQEPKCLNVFAVNWERILRAAHDAGRDRNRQQQAWFGPPVVPLDQSQPHWPALLN